MFAFARPTAKLFISWSNATQTLLAGGPFSFAALHKADFFLVCTQPRLFTPSGTQGVRVYEHLHDCPYWPAEDLPTTSRLYPDLVDVLAYNAKPAKSRRQGFRKLACERRRLSIAVSRIGLDKDA
jgi:hypothetical protein